MFDAVEQSNGVIGPNAILQMVPVLDQRVGVDARKLLLVRAGIVTLPDGQQMIPEAQAARFHRQVREDLPELAHKIAVASGRGTADYILAHRIPGFAKGVLHLLPAALSARLLASAIAQHAWTFAGTGRFEVIDPWTFEVHDNPLIRGEQSDGYLCAWHTAVFARLYQALVAPDCVCREISCGAQGDHAHCQFELRRGYASNRSSPGSLKP